LNPLILADNRFLNGTPTATDTAAGYDVLYIRDYKTFTSWKGGSTGTKYITVDCGTAKSANCIAFARHNFGTGGAQISVESSDNGSDWTERIEPFTLVDDKAALRTFVSASARYWRVKINSPTIAPQVAVLLVGVRIEFPYPPDAPFSPDKEGIEVDTNLSRTGQFLGSDVRFKPYSIRARWGNLSRTWVESYFLPFWDNHASNLTPFFWAWALATYPNNVRFVRVPENYGMESPVSVLGVYDSIELEMEGTKE
jgi:hypothetical protein